MDIIKQITVMIWLLGVVLATPAVLRHFDIDVKTVYRKILVLNEQDKLAARDALASSKREIPDKVFEDIFSDGNATAEQLTTAKQEVKQMVQDMSEQSQQSQRPDVQVSEVPSLFFHERGAEHKVRWLPPPPGFQTAETFNYLIYRQDQAVGEKLKTVLNDIHGNLMLDLTPFTLVIKPNKILVMLFENKDSYMNFTNRPAWSGASSDLRADTMYILEGKNFYPLSVHELTHLYFDGYFLPTISPLWLSEGMAVYMQIYATHKQPSWIERGFQNILSGKYITLDDMFKMEDLTSLTTEQAELWYTQAYSLVDYLLNTRSRDEFYKFCNELKSGTPVSQALYRAYGMPFTKVSVLQNVWLYDLNKRRKEAAVTAATSATRSVPVEVLSSTQTVSVPVVQKPQQQPQPKQKQTPKKTEIPKLQIVETNGYKGYF